MERYTNVLKTPDLKIVAAKMLHLDEQQAAEFYAVHKEKPFFSELVDFMVSGPIMVQVLEGQGRPLQKNRELMGATFSQGCRAGHYPGRLLRPRR